MSGIILSNEDEPDLAADSKYTNWTKRYVQTKEKDKWQEQLQPLIKDDMDYTTNP